MALLDTFAVAHLLEELGTRLELKGESEFKVRAYYRAAETLRELEEALSQVVDSGQLKQLPGIGEALAEKISAFHRLGTHPTLERLRLEVPDGLLELMRVPGLGPKRIRQLHQELAVGDLDSLAEALATGRLAGVKGFGGRTLERLSESLAYVRLAAKQLLLPEADTLMDSAFRQMQHHPDVIDVCPAGETRRRCELISRMLMVVSSNRPASVPKQAGGDHRVEVVAVLPPAFATTLLYETGSPEHVNELEMRARTRGMTLSRDGLFRGTQPIPLDDEKGLYAALGLPWIEPEWREANLDLKELVSHEGCAPVKPGDIRGLLHCHTRFSDGLNTLDEMAEATRALGMSYLGVADHSQSAFYAGGMDEARIREQHTQIDRLNKRYGERGLPFRIFKGIEADIRDDGSLDYPDEVLALFDFVVASVHSQFQLDVTAQTERVLRAVAHPATTILGHPTGRLLRRRGGLKLDLERILQGCIDHGVAIELNAHPERLDLDWRWHARVVQKKGLLSINPDAHGTGELANFRFGVEMARKGRVPAASVLNGLEADALSAYFAARRKY